MDIPQGNLQQSHLEKLDKAVVGLRKEDVDNIQGDDLANALENMKETMNEVMVEMDETTLASMVEKVTESTISVSWHRNFATTKGSLNGYTLLHLQFLWLSSKLEELVIYVLSNKDWFFFSHWILVEGNAKWNKVRNIVRNADL